MSELHTVTEVLLSQAVSQQAMLATSLFSVLVMLLMWRAYRQQQKLQKAQKNAIRLLQQDVRALVNAGVGVGEHVLNLEKRQLELVQQQNKLKSRQVQKSVSPAPATAATSMNMNMQMRMPPAYESSDQPYEQAIRMVKDGVKISDVAKYCGLSRSEAELIAMMHRYSKQPQAVH